MRGFLCCAYIDGATGPAGPTGPANGLSAFGGAYNATAQTLTLTADTPEQIPLATAMPALGITNAPANSITITEPGNYEIDFFTSVDPAATGDIAVSVRRNNTSLPEATVTRRVTGNEQTFFSGSVITALAANDVLDLAITSGNGGTVTLDDGTNASLSVKKLN